MDVSAELGDNVSIPLADWASDVDLMGYPGGVTFDSGAALDRALRSGTAQDPVLFLQLSPPVAAARVVEGGAAEDGGLKGVIPVVMGGSFWGCYDIGTTKPCLEYNVAHNVTASQLFWGVPSDAWAVPMRVVPTVPARVFSVNGSAFAALKAGAHSSPAAASLLGAFAYWYSHGGKGMIGPLPWAWGPQIATSAVYDLLAAWAAAVSTNASQPGTGMPPCVSREASALSWEWRGVRVLPSGMTQFCSQQQGALRRGLQTGCQRMLVAHDWGSTPPALDVGNATQCIVQALLS